VVPDTSGSTETVDPTLSSADGKLVETDIFGVTNTFGVIEVDDSCCSVSIYIQKKTIFLVRNIPKT